MSSMPSWQDLLLSANSTAQIVALANEFLGRLEPMDIVSLPNACKIRMLHTPADVNAYAVDLKSVRCDDAREAQVVQQLSAFFQEVCQRLAVITGPQHPLPGKADLWTNWGVIARPVE